MDAETSMVPPAGAAKSETVSMRPDVQEPPESTAVMSRWPEPSSATLALEFVFVSTSPVPNWGAHPVPLYCVPVS
jgi:hypothetical protein